VLYAAGKVTPVYPHFPASTFVNAVELHLGYQTYGNQQWNRLFNYPRLGVSLIYQNLGNNNVFGQQFSIVPMVYFSTAKKETAKVYAELRYGLGLACFNKYYNSDSLTRANNFLTGEHFMWQFTVGASLRWNINQYGSLQFGGVWYHASDAHTQLPNVGVNTFAGFVSALFYPFGRMARSHALDSLPVEKKWHVNFRFGSGYQEKGGPFGPVGGPKYPVYTGSVYVSKRVGKIFLLKAGLTYRYYPMYLSFVEGDSNFNSQLKLKSSAFIVFVGNEFLLGHFAINFEAGVNVYKPAYKDFASEYLKTSTTSINYYLGRYIATRFGASYYFFNTDNHLRNNAFIGACVSANMGEAEFLELNVGYVF
jgi:hypothetical protein